MTKTAARHRAPLSAREWFTRTWLAVSALPVGALAGCTGVAVAATYDRPALGLTGLAAAAVPLTVASWRARLAATDPAHGRRAAGRPVAQPVPAGDGSGLEHLAPAAQPVPIVLDIPDLASLQAATGASADLPASAPGGDVAPRVFTVSAGGTEVEVVVLTREERAARDLSVLEELAAMGADAEEPADVPADTGSRLVGAAA